MSLFSCVRFSLEFQHHTSPIALGAIINIMQCLQKILNVHLYGLLTTSSVVSKTLDKRQSGSEYLLIHKVKVQKTCLVIYIVHTK